MGDEEEGKKITSEGRMTTTTMITMEKASIIDRKERIKDEEQLNAKEDDVIMRIKIPTTKKLTATISNDRGKTLSTSSSSSNSSSMIDSKSKSRNSLEIENRNNTNDTISIDDHYNTMESPGSGESSKHVLSTTLLTMPEQSPTIIEKEKVITKNNSGGRSGSGDMISPNLLNSKETKKKKKKKKKKSTLR